MKRLFAALAVFATALAGIGIAVTPAAAAEPTFGFAADDGRQGWKQRIFAPELRHT